MNTPITIIIACYNDKEYITQCINSVKAQTYPNWQAIIVNDGSNQETSTLLDSFQNDKIKVIHQENKGQSAARNKGIALAKTELIAILDSDDYYEPTYLEEVINCANQYKKATLISTYLNKFSDANNITSTFMTEGGEAKDFLFKNPSVNGSVFKKSNWQQVDGYDESMRLGWEDWEFYIRLMQKDGRNIIVPKPLYNYRIKENSTTTTALKNRTENFKYIFKNNINIYKNYPEELIDHYSKELLRKEKIINELYNSRSYKIGNFLIRKLSWVLEKLNHSKR